MSCWTARVSRTSQTSGWAGGGGGAAARPEPGRRYGSAEALAEDLERWLRGEPIRARRISRRERAAKWVRRRPGLAALLAVVAVAAGALVAGLLWHNARLRAEAERTARERD